VRDRHCAAALGRPIRIRDEDCDVEPLEECDFQENESPDPARFGAQTKTHVLYAIHQAKLAVVFGEILLTKFAVRQPASIEIVQARLTANLKTWFDGVPPDLDHQNTDDSRDDGFWASMLYLLYNHHLILLHRPVRSSMTSSGKSGERIAFNAAKSITRVVDDLLNSEMLRGGQLHIVPSVFAALCMHVIVMRRSSLIQRKLAENHARLCMLALSEWQNSWPAGGWILRLFESLMKNLPAKSEAENIGINDATRVLDTRAAKSLSSHSALLPSLHQPPWGSSSSVDNTEANHNPSGMNSEGLFQPLEPSNLMDLYNHSNENDAANMADFSQVSFGQSGHQNPNYFANLCTDSMARDQEFLLYFMNEFPES